MTSRLIGSLQIILSGICFGFLGIWGKSLLAKGVAPGELLGIRFLTGGTLLGLFLALSAPRHLRLPAQSILKACCLGAGGYAVFSSMFFAALQGLSVSLTVLLLYTYPVIVVLGASLIFREVIPASRLMVLPLVLAGIAMLVGGDFSARSAHFVFLGLGSALFYALYILLAERFMASVHPLASAVYVQLAAGSVLSLLFLRDPGRVALIIKDGWPELLGIACIGSVAAMSLFLAGLKRLKSWEASILSTTEPLAGILLASFFLGESLKPLQYFGGCLVITALIAIAFSEYRGQKSDRFRLKDASSP